MLDDRLCFRCLGRGVLTRRYGTATGGPATHTLEEECPDCGGSGEREDVDDVTDA